MSVGGYDFYDLYEIIPCVTLAVVYFSFVRRGRLSSCGLFLWAIFLIFACGRQSLFLLTGGTSLHPLNLPELLVRVLDVAYFGTVVLAMLAVLFFFWRSRLKMYLLPVVAYSISLVGVLNAIAVPVVHEYTVVSDRVPVSLDGYRIVHISDIHAYCGCRRWHTQSIVDTVNGLDADLVCLTGDYADGRPKDCADYLAPLLDLKAKDGVYAVSGNHEFDADVNPVHEWCAFYRTWGIPFLRNNCVFPRRGLALGGVDDPAVSGKRRRSQSYGDPPDVKKAFVTATNGEFRVLLHHQPVSAEANVLNHGVDLQLSGHLHGGIMPVFKDRIARHHGNRICGLYQVHGGFLCVSAGCGPSSGFPLRFRAPPEIGLIILRRRVE